MQNISIAFSQNNYYYCLQNVTKCKSVFNLRSNQIMYICVQI